jgi:enoyl-CoA hydratase
MPLVRTTDHDGVRVLAFARPPLNAIDLELVAEFGTALTAAAEDEACKAIVVTGEGAAFSAGIDTKVVPAYGLAERRQMIRSINRMLRVLYGAPKPTVAAVNGHALGGALVVALACDARIAAEADYRLGLTEAAAGIPFPAVPMVVVRAELDPSTARVLTLGSATFGARDPVAAAIFDEVHAPGALSRAALARARALAELRGYAKVKRQLKADALARMDAIVERDADPMLDDWI